MTLNRPCQGRDRHRLQSPFLKNNFTCTICILQMSFLRTKGIFFQDKIYVVYVLFIYLFLVVPISM